MLSKLHMRVQNDIRQHTPLAPNQHLLLAVSGGQDSLCMLQILHDLAPRWQWQLSVMHCDHRWQPSESTCAEAVLNWAEQLDWPCVIATAATITPDENRARQWRYRMLDCQANRWNCDAVLTAHTGSDRAETMLFNLIRGGGPQGLSTLTWSRPLRKNEPVPLVRPLLGVWRNETAQFCQTHQLPVWEDTFNFDLSHPRNCLRLRILPQLKRINPQVEKALNRTTTVLADEHSYLQNQVEAIWPQIFEPDPPRLHRGHLLSHHIALQRRAIIRFLSLYLHQSPNFERVEGVRILLSAGNGSRTPPFPGGQWAEANTSYVYLRG